MCIPHFLHSWLNELLPPLGYWESWCMNMDAQVSVRGSLFTLKYTPRRGTAESHGPSRLPRWQRGKNPPPSVGDAGDPGSVPGAGRPPGGGDGSPLQDCCLENSTGRGAWWAAVHGVAESWARLKRQPHVIILRLIFSGIIILSSVQVSYY